MTSWQIGYKKKYVELDRMNTRLAYMSRASQSGNPNTGDVKEERETSGASRLA